jgi:hypothetical protein
VNSLDKRADCTTTLGVDVDAAMHDRTAASCGVNDVLAPLAASGLAQLSHAFLPRPQQPPALAPNCASKAQYPLSCLALGIQ